MLAAKEVQELKIFSCEIRKKALMAIASVGAGHVGGAMSMVEALSVLYGKVMNVDPENPKMEDRDRFVLSKGHSGPSLYATLCLKGFISEEALKTMNRGNTILPSHVDRQKTPGVDYSTGSLGQGISLAVGSALGARMMGKAYRTYCIVGDGECDEGQVWEAALFAGHYKLSNLTVMVDNNQQQLDGYTKDVMNLRSIGGKFREFGWNVLEVDGHDVAAIYDAIESAKCCTDMPTVIVLNTIKGKGCMAAEKAGLCHHIALSWDMYEAECAELDRQIEELRKEGC